MFPNGTFYLGRFSENKPNGKGTWFLNNGNKLKGNYKQNKVTNEDDPDNVKVMINLDWQSNVGICESAWKINAHENF